MATPSNLVSYSAEGANMYGCQPCPRCRKPYRFQMAKTGKTIHCDDCGFTEEGIDDHESDGE